MPWYTDWVARGSNPESANNTLGPTRLNQLGTLINQIEDLVDSINSRYVDDDDPRLTNQRVPVDGSVTSTKIAAGAVTASKLNVTGVPTTTSILAYDGVTLSAIEPPAGGGGGDGGVPDDNSVSTAKIQNGAVTHAKLSTDSVGTVNLQDESVTEAKLASDAVGTNHLQAAAVTANELAANAVGVTHLQDDSVTTDKIAANAVDSDQIKAGAVGNTEIATGAVDADKLNIAGTPSATTFLKFDGTTLTAVDPPAGGGSSNIEVYEEDLGDGTDSPTVVTHNKNTRSVFPVITRNVGPALLLGKVPGEPLIVPHTVDTENQITLRHDGMTWEIDEYHLALWCFTGADVTGPDTPVLTVGTITNNSVEVSVTGTAYARKWLLDGVVVAVNTSATHTFTPISSSTQVDVQCIALDLVGNESPSNIESPTTTGTVAIERLLAPPIPATVDSDPGSGPHTINVGLTIPAGYSNVALVCAVIVNHSSWANNLDDWTTFNASSDLDGGLTLLGRVNQGPAGQKSGSAWVFGKLNCTNIDDDLHTLTANFDRSGMSLTQAIIVAEAYSNIVSFGVPEVLDSTSATVLNHTSSSIDEGDKVFGVHLFESAPSGFNRTVLYSGGASTGGYADYVIASEADGPVGGGTINYATSSSQRWSSLLLPLNRI